MTQKPTPIMPDPSKSLMLDHHPLTFVDGYWFGLCTITPELSDYWLVNFKKAPNRDERKVKTYSLEMRAGHWLITDACISFHDDLSLANGHNRLEACRRSGASFESFVLVGISKPARENIDTGSSRTARDVNKMAQRGHYASAVSTASKIWYLPNSIPGIANTPKTHKNLLDWMDGHRDAFNFTAQEFDKHRSKDTYTRHAIRAVFFRAYYHLPHSKLSEIIEKLCTGADLPLGDGLLTLRDWLTKKGDGKGNQDRTLYWLVNEWLYRYDIGATLPGKSELTKRRVERFPLPEEAARTALAS